jgi:hypothetical protein
MLIALLILSIAPAADWPDLIIPPAHVGLVPTLATPPADLPLAVDRDGGTWVPSLRARYVAAQVSALYRFPKLSQDALDLSLEAERDACELRVADARAELPTWWDRLRSGVVWGIGGALVGGLLVAWVSR